MSLTAVILPILLHYEHGMGNTVHWIVVCFCIFVLQTKANIKTTIKCIVFPKPYSSCEIFVTITQVKLTNAIVVFNILILARSVVMLLMSEEVFLLQHTCCLTTRCIPPNSILAGGGSCLEDNKGSLIDDLDNKDVVLITDTLELIVKIIDQGINIMEVIIKRILIVV